MKRTILTLFLAVACTASAFSQFNFRLTYGTLNSKMATFGYDLCKFTPYASLDLLTVGFDMRMPQAVDMTVKGSIVAPMIGVRYHFLETDNGKLKGYGNFGVQKWFVGGRYDNMDWEEDDNVWVGDKYKLTDVVDKKNIWQFQLGFGAEYFFDENLSLVAEYGFRILNSKIETKAEFADMDVKVNAGMTYTRLGLAFHF